METMHIFGVHDHLFGVHCQKYQRSNHSFHLSPQKNGSAVLMLTAGMLESSGPNRLHVQLASSLAEAGLPSFRFDLSGIGESLGVGSNGESLSRSASETSQAIDLLQNKYGYKRFLLFGLCSGADDAIHTAIVDKRIEGAFLLDACGFKTRWHLVHWLSKKMLPKALTARKWQTWLNDKVRGASESKASLPMGTDIREFPPQVAAEAELIELLDRGVHLHFLYTSGVIDYYSYADQFFDMFPKLRGREHLSTSFHPNWDHVLLLKEDRDRLVALATDWFARTAENFTVPELSKT